MTVVLRGAHHNDIARHGIAIREVCSMENAVRSMYVVRPPCRRNTCKVHLMCLQGPSTTWWTTTLPAAARWLRLRGSSCTLAQHRVTGRPLGLGSRAR